MEPGSRAWGPWGHEPWVPEIGGHGGHAMDMGSHHELEPGLRESGSRAWGPWNRAGGGGGESGHGKGVHGGMRWGERRAGLGPFQVI